jgi:cell division protein ZapA
VAQVNVSIAGKTYRMACEDGQEEHLGQLAERLNGMIEKFRGLFGEIGDQRLTVMAAIAMADQVDESQQRIARLEADLAALEEARAAVLAHTGQIEAGVAETIDQVAARIEAVAGRLADRPAGNGAGYDTVS